MQSLKFNKTKSEMAMRHAVNEMNGGIIADLAMRLLHYMKQSI